MDIKQKFGEKVRKTRGDKDMTQEKLASLCNLHRTYISDIERGKRNVSIENIEKIANALDITIEKLFKKL